jgi:hypothetical protein
MDVRGCPVTHNGAVAQSRDRGVGSEELIAVIVSPEALGQLGAGIKAHAYPHKVTAEYLSADLAPRVAGRVELGRRHNSG